MLREGKTFSPKLFRCRQIGDSMIGTFNSLGVLFEEMTKVTFFFFFQVVNIKIFMTSLGLSSYSREESGGTGYILIL